MSLQKQHELLVAAAQAVRKPSGKQKEAYGRLLHTLCAAALIGATSLTFSSMGACWYDLGKVLALLLLAVLFFFFGAILSKGD